MSASPENLDVILVGAGLSGIGAAFHLQKRNPGLKYALLEARDEIGGTWDLFRYPGIRSDSDMSTLGYSFRPWSDAKAIADGPSIRAYIKETALECGIDRHIRRGHEVTAAEWSSEEVRWTVTARRKSGETATLKCRFLILCSGYYDYERGYTPEYAGLEKFRGDFVHPQQWDEAYDYSGKRIVVIGSGATAVTLVPELAKKAAQVTMLQRSPSYFAPLPSIDAIAEWLKRKLPARFAYWLIRWKNILLGMAVFWICRWFPNQARKFLQGGVSRALRGKGDMENFTPRYDPWDQRLCFVPDSDFFKAMRRGNADVVTDSIETFTESGVRLKSGRELPADLVITATGLRLKFLGGLSFTVDGKRVNITDTVPYKGAMLSGVPNLGMTFGYTNASWTLKCDLIAEWLSKVIRYMDERGYAVVTPDASPDIDRVPLVDFSSGYFQRAKDVLPRQGTRTPWKLSQNYFADLLAFRARPLADEGLTFTPG